MFEKIGLRAQDMLTILGLMYDIIMEGEKAL